MVRRKKTANMEIKEVNRSSIFRLLLKNDGLTKQDIVQNLQLSLPTVTQNIVELMGEGLVKEKGSIGNTGGRRAKTYSIVRKARTAVGLDITRNHITAVMVDLTGSIIDMIRIRKQFKRSGAYYRTLGDVVEDIICKAQVDPKCVLGVGFGVPGLITADNRKVFFGEILNFTGATCEEFSAHVPYKSALYNDANAAGFAEIWANPEIKNAFYLMLSNNIGGSVLIGSNIYSGEGLHSGEVGHITVVPGGKRCYCGQIGCVDAYCAATNLSSLTDGNLQAFFSLLERGDETAVSIFDEYLDHLALTVKNLYMLFDCTIILGGYVGAYIDAYMDKLTDRAARLNPFEKNAEYLKVCRYQKEAIAAGAALNFIAEFLDSI